MRIGIMLRHLGQHGGGVLVYTRNLLRELLSLDTPHEFVLLYRDPALVGTYAAERVRELAITSRSVLGLDQVAAPRAAKREGVDLLFNPKYSVPLATACKTVFVCHGLDWYVNSAWSRWQDRMSHRFLVPRYAHKADRVIAVSEVTREHVIQYLGVEAERVETVHLGLSEAFRQPVSDDRLAQVRDSYGLPDRFFLYCGQIYPPKNFGRLLQAYARAGPELGISLVVAGEHTWLSKEELDLIEELDLARWVVRAGWVEHETLRAFYTLAEALLLPSLYEACPSPPLEAMACGCPVLTADRYGTKEIAGDAALLIDPEDIGAIAAGIRRIAQDGELREQLIAAGHARQREFSWARCARETLRVLESAAEGEPKPRGG